MKNFYEISKAEVIKTLNTTEKGLTSEEAENRLKSGRNVFIEGKKKNFFSRFLAQFKNVLIIILLLSAILSLVVALIEKESSEYINVGIILAVVLINAIIGVIQETKADKSMEKLKSMTHKEAKVYRDKKLITINAEELVVGDVILIEAGDIIPADVRLIECASLKTNESALTGESLPSEKNCEIIYGEKLAIDISNMAYMGTTAVYGRAKGVVVNTGMSTEMGQIANLLNKTKQEDTPLTKRVKKTSIIISAVVLLAAILVLVLGLLSGKSVASSLILAVAIAVCAVPEGLPASVTITMAIGVYEMSKRRAIVKNLAAVETLGSTEIICSDKTGTLTMNKMVVKEVFTLDKTNVGEQNLYESSKNYKQLYNAMLLCNDSQLKLQGDVLKSLGDPTEVALTEYGYNAGIFKEALEAKFERVSEIPFDSDRKLMTTINTSAGGFMSYTKGALDGLLAGCNRALVNGKTVRLSNTAKEEILLKNKQMAQKSLRVLAFAYKEGKSLKEIKQNAEENMIFVGLVGMMDPPREEVLDSIKTCKAAGIGVVMITGDNKDTAFSIAKELSIASDESEVITGRELDDLTEVAFNLAVTKYKVYARVSPSHKVRIVEALKNQNKVVAMTGDGVNDAPSLKRADIGVGMGITGTDVTKDAADVILTDDNFATIVGAVKEGRRVYDNIVKVVQYLIGTSIAELFVLTTITSIFNEPFFTPILILWFNLISDTLVGLALAAEAPEKNVMNRPPTQNKGTLFSGRSGINMIVSAISVSALVLGVFFVGKYALKFTPPQVTTMCFVTLLVSELLHAYNLKSDIHSIFDKNLFKNKWLNGAFVISLFLSLLLILLPFPALYNVLGTSALSGLGWLISLIMAALIIPIMEIEKLILRSISKHKKINRKN